MTKSHLDWEILNSEYPLKDRWIAVRADEVKMPNGTVLSPFYALEYPDYVHVVAITTEGEMVLVRQYRHGAQEALVELPAGTRDKGEDPIKTAQRELQEETGYASDEWIQLPNGSVNPATHANVCYNFLALNCTEISGQNLDESEEIELLTMSVEDVKKELPQGLIYATAHAMATFYGLSKLDELSQ